MACRRALTAPVFTVSATANANSASKVHGLFEVGQVRGLQREALGFGIAEHGFDPRLRGNPALAITRERMTRPVGTGQRQQLAWREPRYRNAALTFHASGSASKHA